MQVACIGDVPLACPVSARAGQRFTLCNTHPAVRKRKSLEVSPYLEFGDGVFVGSGGHEGVPVFVTSIPALYLLPAPLADVLRAKDMETLATLDAAQRRSLESRGILVPDLKAAREQVEHQMRAQEEDIGRRTYTLLPTAYCNMSCVYCGQEHLKGRLDESHRSAIEERVLAGIRASETRSVHVAWFGGEPMLAYKPMIQMATTFVSAAHDCGVAYSSKITTNGSLLTVPRIGELVEAGGVDRFDITIDGPARIHDRHRPMKNGHPTFDRLIDVLRVALHQYPSASFILRTNIDKHNVECVDEYLDLMADLGFANQSNAIFQLSPIHSWGNDIASLEAPADEFLAMELEWFAKMGALGLNHSLVPAELSGATCVATEAASEVLDRDGRIYSCTEYPLVPGESQSKVVATADGLLASARRPSSDYDGWSGQIADRHLPCDNCSLLPVCGGGCPKQWVEQGVSCPTLRGNISGRLSLLCLRRGLQKVRTWR